MDAAVSAYRVRDRAEGALPAGEDSGGVSTSLDKLVLQAYLSDFAVQCAERRDGEGRDLLDRHGHLAPFLRRRSPATVWRIGWLGSRLMVTGDVADDWPLV